LNPIVYEVQARSLRRDIVSGVVDYLGFGASEIEGQFLLNPLKYKVGAFAIAHLGLFLRPSPQALAWGLSIEKALSAYALGLSHLVTREGLAKAVPS